MPSLRCLLLDLDGTLVDSLPDLTAALNRLMTSRGLASFGLDEVRPMVGDGAGVLVERAMAARGRSAAPGDVVAFRDDYTAHSAVETRPFPGIEAALDQLASDGWTLAVCTNKPAAATRALLDALGLSRRFSGVGAGDSFPTRKPDPGHVLGTLALLGGVAQHAVMVGDHRNDVLSAAGAGLPSLFAAWGYGDPSMAEGASGVIARVDELPDAVSRLVPA